MLALKKLSLLSALLVMGPMSSAWAQGKMDPGSYAVDSAHSKVGFEIAHLVISTVEGKFTKFEGTVDLADKFENSKVQAEVDMTSIDTGVAKRDNHLRSPDFFDVKKFPTMTFKSTKIAGGPESFKLTGDLSLHGVTKTVVFDGKYLGSVVDGWGNQKVAFTAQTKINRKDFGLKWNNMVEVGPVVGDQVSIDLKIQAGRPLPKKDKSGK